MQLTFHNELNLQSDRHNILIYISFSHLYKLSIIAGKQMAMSIRVPNGYPPYL